MPSSCDVSIVALHGFTQSGAMWQEVAGLAGGTWVAPDLPGHGGPPVPDWAAAVSAVSGALAATARPRLLIGYSLGGRMALGALANGAITDAAVIMSASPGIADPAVRSERQAADAALAATIRRVGVAAFVDEWLARPMFAGLADRETAWRVADRAMRVAHDPEGLALALERLGQGVQEPVLDRLDDVGVPVELVVGERDPAYREMASVMAERLPRASVTVLSGAGHAVVAERPGEVATVIRRAMATVVGSEHTFD